MSERYDHGKNFTGKIRIELCAKSFIQQVYDVLTGTPDRAKRWLAFLRNHREAIAAMDFFTVPTITFGVRYCFFIISHDRRRILHVNVTKHPTSAWIIQQLREAFPFEASHRYVIFDRDQKFGFEVIATHLGVEKATPDGRIRSVALGRVLAQERLGGQHHRYDRAA
jgi:hypothetical protein